MQRKIEDILDLHKEELVADMLKEDILNLHQLDTESKLRESMLEVLGYYMPGREYEDFIRENNLKKDD